MFRPGSLQSFRAPRLWWALWWLAWVTVLVASLLPAPALDLAVSHGDKWLHLVVHAVLAAYAIMIFRSGPPRLLALAALMLLGIAIEALQALLPWRSSDGWDLLANVLGTALGCAVLPLGLQGVVARVDLRLFAARAESA